MLKEKLMLALSDEALRQRIAENAQRSVAAYDWTRIGLRFSSVLKEPVPGFENLVYRH